MDRLSILKVRNFKYLLLVVLLGLVGWQLWPKEKQVILSPEAPFLFVEKPLNKYRFKELRQRDFSGSEIRKERILFRKFDYEAWLFKYKLDDGKVVSGQMNIPSGIIPEGGWPVVVLLRGFVEQNIYKTGMGTKNAAGYFASNGFLTLAPDFLGFGESDNPPENVFAERFLRPVEVLQLIASIKKLEIANADKINIWGHSNGGQVALSVLEISGGWYPTSLWAPVSKPFPYSILYYTDEFDDYGKALREVLAGLEAQYDVDDYNIAKYFSWIKAPIQIHQGTSDEAVPIDWSEDLKKKLKAVGVKVELYVYREADHNLAGGWDLAVRRSLEWFSKN